MKKGIQTFLVFSPCDNSSDDDDVNWLSDALIQNSNPGSIAIFRSDSTANHQTWVYKNISARGRNMKRTPNALRLTMGNDTCKPRRLDKRAREMDATSYPQ